MAGFNDVAPQPLYPNVVEQVPQHLAILTTPPARLTRASIQVVASSFGASGRGTTRMGQEAPRTRDRETLPTRTLRTRP